ncbi:alpha/beta fold hydrolase [Solihabitans fulvus]|uniref:Alpha/beta fold hydrolase n=1 Tax=Solihabitans fulvus TaxID=1892852 RepID=A0A5B2WQ23_9PSEU|nr:thioesterase domain-containing protein [Solihabitans fulvus]KAA2252832.1 alpha/beta fold hydrolase [Solihabitans fulvus]
MNKDVCVHRVASPGDLQARVLERAWLFVTGGLQLSRLPTSLARVCWSERDDTLHEQAVRELDTVPGDVLRGTLLCTGSRSELHFCSDPAEVDQPGLARVVEDVLTTYRGLNTGRLMVPEVAQAAAADVPSACQPSAKAPPELVVLNDAGRPHLHLYYPGAGVGAAYRDLVAALPSHWTITACDDAQHAESVEAMSESYLAALTDRFARPDLLGGWSMGGLVGLDAVRRLADRGSTNRPGLVLLDSPPPTRPDTESRVDGQVGEFAEFLWESFALRRYQPVVVDVGKDDDLGLRLLSAGLSRAGEEVQPEWLAEWLVQYRRQLRVLSEYRRSDRTDVRALLLLGALTEEQIAEWRRVVGHGLSVEQLGGGHFELLRPPFVTEAARLMAARLASGVE